MRVIPQIWNYSAKWSSFDASTGFHSFPYCMKVNLHLQWQILAGSAQHCHSILWWTIYQTWSSDENWTQAYFKSPQIDFHTTWDEGYLVDGKNNQNSKHYGLLWQMVCRKHAKHWYGPLCRQLLYVLHSLNPASVSVWAPPSERQPIYNQ